MNAPLFLFTGPESGERADAVKALRESFAKKAGALDAHSFYAAETSVAGVVSLLMNGSLFAAARFVVLNNAELIKKKEDIELIAEWAKAADGAAVLVLVSDEVSVDKKLEGLVPKENKKIFWELFQDRKEQWLRSFFQREGYKIEDEAVEVILELVENNTAELRKECSRFFVCFEKGRCISAEDVESLLSHNREESAFTLFDALAANEAPSTRLENALAILQKLRLSKDSSPAQLIAGLTYSFRKLQTWQKLVEAGDLSSFELKAKGFASKKAQEQCQRACRIWNQSDTARILGLLASWDVQLRSGAQALEDTLLQLMLYSIVQKRGEPPAEYISA